MFKISNALKNVDSKWIVFVTGKQMIHTNSIFAQGKRHLGFWFCYIWRCTCWRNQYVVVNMVNVWGSVEMSKGASHCWIHKPVDKISNWNCLISPWQCLFNELIFHFNLHLPINIIISLFCFSLWIKFDFFRNVV